MKASEKAEALIEALPYLQKFRNKVMVIKYGGAAMENEGLIESVLRDIIFLEAVGINPVVVHGGGKAITRAMKDSGLTATFIDGLRVSDKESMKVIEKTLAEEINPSIVKKMVQFGGKAKGVPGRTVLEAKKIEYRDAKTNQSIDLGFVGDITKVRADVLKKSIAAEEVPVISPIAEDGKGQVYNINADIAASEIAQALKAYKIIYLSDVNGIMRDPSRPDSTISTLTIGQIDQLKKEGVLDGGMLPKVDSAVKALNNGVEKVHFLDGRIPHSLLLEIFTDAGIGTEITSS
jgi:acetylglutamate kinase